jgi:3',5'-cyclic AMP phosphodiesterase CpdA
MFVLAHLSDPHLAPLPQPRLDELMNKRAIGFFNWWRKRAAIHRADILDRLVRDIKERPHDHIAVTGDVVNIALAAEFKPARIWLDHLGPSDMVTFVPGNHDAYVKAGIEQAQREWAPSMRGDNLETFPFVRRRGPVALIGLSSAVPTPLFMATGRLGGDQMAKLETLLAKLGREGLFRIVLIHHPPVSTARRHFKRLTDSAGFRAALKKHGAELVIHGHNHVRSRIWLDGPDRLIPALGVPSASGAADGRHEPAGYNLFEIDGKAKAWTCTVVARGLSPDGTMIEEKRDSLVR